MRIVSLFIFMCLMMNLSSPALSQWQTFSYVAMTTPLELVFWEENSEQAEAISQSVFAEFDRIEKVMSRYIDSSELSLVNRDAYEAPVRVSDELFSVLRSAMSISEMSHGAFDISYASVGYLYDFREKLKPSITELQNKLPAFHYQHILLDENNQTIQFDKPNTLIDLGGIAKGYAVDRGIEILKRKGVHSAHLSAGGDMRLLGDKLGAPWIIGIRNPRDETKQAILLPLTETAVSTSGDYERFFIDDKGERIHHILSPTTGKPVKGMMSVTILATDAITSDGLSTAVFVLGVEKGLALINSLEGVDAILIDAIGKVHYSDGLARPESAK